MNELKKLILQSDFYRTLHDSSKHTVEILAPSLEEGMEEAAELLGCEIHELEYEIIEEGSEGVFGIGKKPYRMEFSYTPPQEVDHGFGVLEDEYALEESGAAVAGEGGVANVLQAANENGKIEVRVTRNGVMLTVFPPKGKGKPITDPLAVNQELMKQEIYEYDVEAVKSAIAEQTGEAVKIGEWHPNFTNDGRVNLDVSDDEMRVFVRASAPKKGGREVDEQDIYELLENGGIVFGVDEEAVTRLVEQRIYDRPYLIAQGAKPQRGVNARIEYLVNTEKKSVPKHVDENSNVDFKDLSLIENVTVGHVLAKKQPMQEGVPGRTVRGGYLEATDGQDVDIKNIIGNNVELSEDGMQVISQINGQVVFRTGKLSVEPVYEVKGDVGPETGNITFLGNVIVTGSVSDNYKIQAAGNIEVKGSVGKAELEAEGDVIVKLGIQGHEEGRIKAGNDVIAKFIQYANVDAGRDVVVTEAVMNSNVDAGRRIILVGKRATISGGRTRAFEEVNGKTFGATSGAKTEIMVGISPRLRQKIEDLTEEKENGESSIEDLERNISLVESQAKQKKIDEEKEQMLEEDKEKCTELRERLEEIEKELEEISSYLLTVDVDARISAAKAVHPGVKVYVKEAFLEVRDTFKSVTFVEEANNIQIEAYAGKPDDVTQAAL